MAKSALMAGGPKTACMAGETVFVSGNCICTCPGRRLTALLDFLCLTPQDARKTGALHD